MRRRLRGFARSRRGSFRGFKRGRSRRSGGKIMGSLVQVDAMAYGALRQYVSNLISPLTSKIPLGNLSDEVAMGVINYFVAKKTGGMIGDIARKGLIIENARVGEYIVQTGLGGMAPSVATSSSPIYGV